jgi:hypothetical protein
MKSSRLFIYIAAIVIVHMHTYSIAAGAPAGVVFNPDRFYNVHNASVPMLQTVSVQPPLRITNAMRLRREIPMLSLEASVFALSRLRLDGNRFADTTRRDHKIEVFTDVGAERGAIRVTLGEAQPIEVAAFNILGKRIMDIYVGDARTGANNLSFDMSSLSNGLYICVVRGRNFKTAEKFLVSR